ncbi:response regulator [Mucilaginibacter roseus]|uniref:Response regulator n=1 Tax=Mucilaginibacter roseus TaxID=1528868 RepID=A0ABS8U3H3_9SPHI|nr:response regulator [Mucilaginibacter roseus]MCD8740116.1 response regulator [Mucilaginibacter roseus]
MKKSVLLIENDEAIAEIVDYILTDAGYEVSQTPSVHYLEAVRSLKPDVVLLDYSLSGNITGDMICAQLKSNIDTAHIPVIIVSAVVGLDDIARACRADDILVKPFDITDLEQVVNKWFNKSRLAS